MEVLSSICTHEEAVEISQEILKKMERNSIVEKLEEVSTDTIPSVPATISPVPLTCTAQNGSSVVAPSITGCHFRGPFNLNISIGSTGQESNSPSQALSTHEASVAPVVHSEIQKKVQLVNCQRVLKSSLKKRFSHLLETGLETRGDQILLNKIYTELYITKGGSGEVNNEHEVRQIEAASRITMTKETSIQCNNLFLPLPGQDGSLRTVLTMGVAGIGKTVAANKFILDWAEERANQSLEFIFPLSFRELNLMNKEVLTLSKILFDLFPAMKDSGITAYDEYKVLFILDGLDESRLSLDFHNTEIVSDVTKPTSVDVLLTNLIRGDLFPSALIWITSRPAAAHQIPPKYVDLVTEVRGFNNPQKEEYFRKRIDDENLANRIIAHMKSSRSLHIMCHIPVFCWMAATVLQKKFMKADSNDMPKTLTQMYTHFLALQEKSMNMRLLGRRESNADWTRTSILSLGKLAFKELEKGHLIFYEKDLKANGIDVTQASLFSGVYTQIFSNELTLCKEKVFCFVHLSVQEFFAALYVFLTFNNDNVNVLVQKPSVVRRFLFRDSSALILYKAAVDKALQSENGHFDLFLRFLLGLSLESNQTLLEGLLTKNRTNPQTRLDIIKHIKEKIRASPSPERCINLFHCLNELSDCSLVEEIQSYLSSGNPSGDKLSPAQWATLVYVLLTSEDELGVFELSKYDRSEEGLLRLLPVIKASQVALLNRCQLTETCCKTLATAVNLSQLKVLDLSENNLRDSGVMLLSTGLTQCKLETLRLKRCNLTQQCCDGLASLLSSLSSQLRELEMTDNDLQDSGVRRLSDGLGSPHCKLEKLNLSFCGVTEKGCAFLVSALNSNPSHLRELDLSYTHPGHSGRQLISALLEDPRCGLEKLSMDHCGEPRAQPGPKKYTRELTLDPNTAHRDLTLSEGYRKATRWTKQTYLDHPERFDFRVQVLCSEGLTERCYWETEWSGRALIGVAYKRINRKGEDYDCWLGKNDSSWGLFCKEDTSTAWHKGTATAVPLCSNRVGVYLDWLAGTLSFYRISSGTLTRLHTFHASFTEPLYPGFWLAWPDSSVSLC